MSDIFISYKREEQAIARTLANALESEGWTIWWDPKLRAGEHFDDVIEKALNDAKCVIVMWSNLSVNSEYVKAEATEALEQRKLIPIKIESVNLPFRFKRVHTASLIDWDGSKDFSDYRRLVDDISTILGPSPGVIAAEEQRRLEAEERHREDEKRLREQERQRADEEARRKAEEENRKRIEEERSRAQQEAEQRRLEAEARRKAEEERIREQEKQQAEKEARRKAEERDRAEQDAEQRRLEAEAQRRAEEEEGRFWEQERQWSEEEAKRKAGDFIKPDHGNPDHGNPSATLVGVGGPVRGQRFSIDKPYYRIGRHSNNDLRIPGDDSLQGNHACLRYEKGGLFLFDEGSLNGTFLNGQRVTGTPLMVRHGDRIRLGESVFEVAGPLGGATLQRWLKKMLT